MKVKTGSESAMDLSPEFKHWYRKLKRPKNLRDAYILFRSIFHERNGEKPEGTTLLSSGGDNG